MSMQPIPGGICAPKGFQASGVHCGIRHNKTKTDLALILSDTPCSAAAVYTQNKVQGAPLLVTKQNIANGRAQGILCNSGNANTCNANGADIANQCCALAANATGLAPQDFIIASTGVIGQPLSMPPFQQGIPAAANALSGTATGSAAAANAILTTDTIPKEFAYQFTIGGKTCHIGAIGKGSGMINPNMATLLIFITTDVAIAPAMLSQALSLQTKVTFNQICIDGDTSTNDMATVLANGRAQNPLISSQGDDFNTFSNALYQVCMQVSRAIAADGEGATKLLECIVQGAPTQTLALAISKHVIASDLFKAAMFGGDANWGRALCAVGYTPGNFSADNVSLTLKSSAGSVHVCENSAFHPFSENEAAKVLAQDTIQILIHLHDGDANGMAWGCDLTYDYVKINGDYRT